MALLLPVGGKAPPQEDTGHWYTRSGACAYDQPKSSGGRRGTTLADARKLGLVPSVTTVLSVLAKPQLVTWMVEQGIMAALTLPRMEGEAERDFLARVREDSKAQTKAASEEGTRIHDAIECHFKGRDVPARYMPHVDSVLEKLRDLYPGVNDWVAERSFAHPSGYGGKVDIHSPSTGLTGDYKGKDGDFSDGKKLAFDQHLQLAPYQRGLRLPRAPAFNLFVSRTHPGKVAHHIWKEADVDHGWEVFSAALQLWKALKKFDPAWEAQSNAA